MSVQPAVPFMHRSAELEAAAYRLDGQFPVPPDDAESLAGSHENAGDGHDVSEPFPIQSLPEPVRRYVTEVSAALGVPLELAATTALGCLSASLGAGLELRSGNRSTVRGNVFLLAVGKSGSGKGLVFSEVMKPLRDHEIDNARRWRESTLPGILADLESVDCGIRRVKGALSRGKGSEDELQAELRTLHARRVELEGKRDFEPLVFVSDATKEALAAVMPMAPGEALASLSAEARGAIDILRGRYSKAAGFGDEDFYLSGFSGDSCKVLRCGRPTVHLKRPCLSLFWAVQPDKLVTLLSDPAAIDSGLLPRFLVVVVNTACTEPGGEITADHEWASLVESLLELRQGAAEATARVVCPTEDAAAELARFRRDVREKTGTDGELRDLDSFASRWPENAYRTALLLHAAEHGAQAAERKLNHETAENAVSIVDWFSKHTIGILAQRREDAQWARLERLECVLRRYDGERTLRLLKSKNGFTEAEILGLVAEYPHRVSIELQTTAGRPSNVIRLARRC